MGGTTRVIQVTNVAPGATLDQMKTLFGFLGDIEDIKLFPGEDSIVPVTSRVCFVKYEDPTSVGVAQHLTNTVFIDRALIVVPCGDGIIPDEHKALAIAAPANAVAGLMPTPSGGGLLPTPATGILGQVGGLLPTPAPGILGQVPSLVGLAGAAQITAPFDSTLAALGLPQPPPLPGNVDPSKIEEIRRTIYVGNLDSQTVTAEQLLNFFSQVGEVKYVRMAGDETQPTRFAFVEFSDQKSVAAALTYNGVMFGGRPLKINHSNNAIVKPQTKTPEAAAREMEEAMKRVRDAQALIQAAIDPELGPKAGSSTDEFKDNDTDVKKKKSRSRSRSRDRHKRSRSRSRSKRRSRSRSRRRSRSRGRYSRSPRRRSHSPRRRRSRSRSRGRDRRRSRSRSRDHKRSRTPPRGYRGRYTRSRSSPSGATGNSNKTGERRRRSRSPRSRRSRSRTRRSPKRRSRSSSDSPKRSKRKKKDKDRDRERDRERDRSRERERSKKHKRDKDRDREHRESKSKEVKVTRDYDEEEKGYDSDKERDSSSSSKEQQNDDRDIKDERDYSPKENTEQMDMDLSD